MVSGKGKLREAFQKCPVPVKCLYPFALGGVSGRKLSKSNPYSIIFIETNCLGMAEKEDTTQPTGGHYLVGKEGSPLGGFILAHSGFFVHCIYWTLPMCPALGRPQGEPDE